MAWKFAQIIIGFTLAFYIASAIFFFFAKYSIENIIFGIVGSICLFFAFLAASVIGND